MLVLEVLSLQHFRIELKETRRTKSKYYRTIEWFWLERTPAIAGCLLKDIVRALSAI